MQDDNTNILPDVMVALDTVVLEYQNEGCAIALGSLPPWYLMFANMLGAEDPKASLPIAQGFPYLEFFLTDAEPYWDAGGGEPLSSGIWYETCQDVGECHFEARAMLVNGRRILMIEKMGERFEEQRQLIQIARESHLEYDRELGKQQRVAEVLRAARHELERSVAERTAALTAANRNLRDEISEHQRTAEKLLAYQMKLRKAALRLGTIEESERRRIATALHDQIGQMLAISKIRLGTAKMLEKDDAVTEQLNDVESFIDEVIAYTRSLTFELGSPVLYELGLRAALENLVEQAEEQHSFAVPFHAPTTLPTLGETVNVILFQAVRELVFNASKYANAKNVTVSTSLEDGAFRIRIDDDGDGFDTAIKGPNVASRSGFGLFNIGERMESIGGNLIIESAPGQGCHVTLEVPVETDDRRKDARE